MGPSLPLPPLVARSALQSQITYKWVSNVAMLCYTLFATGGWVCCLLKILSKSSAGRLMPDQGSDWIQTGTKFHAASCCCD